MPKIEVNTKSWLQQQYNISQRTLWRYLRYLCENYKRLAQERNEPSYLSFEEYNTHCHKLTPKQIEAFKKHYGEA